MIKNTASQKWRVFAFDATDGSPKTGDAGNITAKISKDGAALAPTDDTNPTELESGWYEFDLLQAETNADEILIVPVSSTADIEVVGAPANVITNPSNFGDLGIESDGDVTKVNTAEAVTGISAGGIKATSIDTDAIGSDELAASAVTEIQNGLATAAALTTVDTVVDAIKAVTDLLPDAGALNDLATILADTNELQTDDVPGLIAALNDPTAAAIADAVLDEALAGHVGAGSLGKAVADIETDATAILADTNELQTDDVPGLIAALNDPTAAAIADAVWDEPIAGHTGAGSTGEALDGAGGAAVNTRFNWGDGTQDDSGTLYWMASLFKNGAPQTDPTACTVQLVLCDGDNTETNVTGASQTISSAPSTDPASRGVYNGKLESLDLTEGLQYYIYVTITQGGSDYKGMIPVKVPVRTA